MSSILNGYTTQATAYEVKDYPYGYTLRTSIFYWIESKAKHGDRLCTYTINPKTGRPNKPKCGNYYTFQYMYLDSDTGHVKTEVIDAYHMEKFQMRFGFIVNKLGDYVSQVQQDNLRRVYLTHMVVNSAYDKVKYSDEMKPVFNAWLMATAKHIKSCPFAELVDHPEPPAQDNPEGKVEYVIREHKEPEPLQHGITEEVVKELLTKTLPGFYVNAEQYTGFTDKHLKIVIACNEWGVQAVSLLLNLATLELRPQIYGGQGGQAIYRNIDPNNPKERWLAMKGEKVTFRTPPPVEKDVLRAIELFAINYKKTLIQFKDMLRYSDKCDYNQLLNTKQPA